MYWQERGEERSFKVSDNIIDLCFKIECKRLPLDHAFALSQALCDRFDWLNSADTVGIHQIHGAESGNGWVRPDNPETDLIHLSRRARFTLRLPKTQLDKAAAMPGTTLNISGYSLKLGTFTPQLLIPQTTLFSRYIATQVDHTDDQFLQQVADEIQSLGIRIHKMISGHSHQFKTADGIIHTRKLMLADLEKDESILLQQTGIGCYQRLGIGLFLPHKGINAVSDLNEDLIPFLEK